MIFETSTTLTPGAGITARLDPALNRITVEVIGHPTPETVGMAVPKVLQLLADKARLPVRHGGQVYRPRVQLDQGDREAWGQ